MGWIQYQDVLCFLHEYRADGVFFSLRVRWTNGEKGRARAKAESKQRRRQTERQSPSISHVTIAMIAA